ncbi:MAG: aromatic amino acid ammonia-lyase [Deltaproteobacteria bacterium]|nr:aromatic amino acid ammonia-lyase [Deltaproteobacteria bacterium]
MTQHDPVAIGARLSIDAVDAVARGARVGLDDAARARLQHSYAFAQRLAAGTTPVYGLTTGCGPLSGARIDAAQREAFQRNLVRSHATSLGAPHPSAWVRAALAVRAQVLAQGVSGVDPAAVATLLGMLNAGIHPIVREVGGVGASGDLVELAQIALAALGEGVVEMDGTRVSASAALRRAGLAPVVPRLREGLALMNGTSFHTGVAALQVARARRLADAATTAAAMSFEALGGHLEALDPALHAARPHPGAAAVAERLRARLAGSRLVRHDEPAAVRQDAYTLRCIAQVGGSAFDAIAGVAAVVETELAAVTDNPLLLADEQRVVHGGNFHGQPVAMALDHLKLAAAELGLIAERRLARLLDPALNGALPPFLIRGSAGLSSGFMGLQYCASAMVADTAVLVAPASVRSVPTNANNQDVVPMGMVAARQAARVLDHLARGVAIELLAAAQALELRGAAAAAPATRTALAAVRALSPPLDDDRPLAEDVEALVRAIDDGAFATA